MARFTPPSWYMAAGQSSLRATARGVLKRYLDLHRIVTEDLELPDLLPLALGETRLPLVQIHERSNDTLQEADLAYTLLTYT